MTRLIPKKYHELLWLWWSLHIFAYFDVFQNVFFALRTSDVFGVWVALSVWKLLQVAARHAQSPGRHWKGSAAQLPQLFGASSACFCFQSKDCQWQCRGTVARGCTGIKKWWNEAASQLRPCFWLATQTSWKTDDDCNGDHHPGKGLQHFCCQKHSCNTAITQTVV